MVFGFSRAGMVAKYKARVSGAPPWDQALSTGSFFNLKGLGGFIIAGDWSAEVLILDARI